VNKRKAQNATVEHFQYFLVREQFGALIQSIHEPLPTSMDLRRHSHQG